MCVLLVGGRAPGLMYNVAPVQQGFGPLPGWHPQLHFAGHRSSLTTGLMSAAPQTSRDTTATQHPPVIEHPAAGQPQSRPPITEQSCAGQPQPGMLFVPAQVVIGHVITLCLVT